MENGAGKGINDMVAQWARSFLAGTPDMVFLKDLNLVYVDASLPFARMVGRSSVREIVGKTDSELFSDQSLARHYVEDDCKMLASGKPLGPYVEPLPERNGKPAWGRTRKDFIYNEREEIVGVYGICVDITDKMELEEDNKRLAEVVVDSNIYAFECDLATDTLYNVRYASIIEEFPPVMAKYPEAFIKLYIHPDSAEEYRRLYGDMKKGLPFSEGKIRYRLGNKDLNMFVRMRNSYDDQGRPVRVYGTARDLSLLTELERQYHITLEQHGIFSWVVDVKNQTFSSSDFIRYEYTHPEDGSDTESMRLAWGVHPEDSHLFQNAYRRLLGGEQRIRQRVRRKYPNSSIWDWMSFCFDGTYEEDGSLSRIYISAVNINKQVESEERYAEFQSYQRMALQNVVASIRLNLTQNTCFKSATKAPGDKAEEYFHTADEFWAYTNRFVCDRKKRDEISRELNRPALLAAFAKGITMRENEIEYDFRESGRRWIRTGIEMMENPYTHDVEALVYSVDIDQQHMLMEIVERLVGMDYELLGIISVDSEMARFYKQSQLEIAMGIPQYLHYPTVSEAFFRKVAAPEDLPQIIHENSVAVIRRELEKQTLYTTSARVWAKGKWSVKKWMYTYLEDRKANIVYTRTDVTDIIESRQREQEELRQALMQAEQASSAKTEFLSRMSHDIRTPMNAIMNLTRLAADDVENTQKLRSDLDKIKLSGDFLLGLINDILEMSRIESGRITLMPTVYPVERFLSYLDSVMIPLFAAKNITFTIRPSALVPAVYVDEVRFNQIFFNVLSNAAKYTPEGGTVTYDVQVLSHDDKQVHAAFIIKDNGIGMSKAFLEKAFIPFEREFAVNAYTGTGLGLPITKAIVEALGGTIELESEQGVGTTVTITLTLPFPPKELWDNYLAGASETDKTVTDSVATGRILIAEDHPLNQEVITRLLHKRGYETVCVGNGREAVEAVKGAKPGEYQLILMDVRMPVMDGLHATKAIRALDDVNLAHIPIIAMTADAFSEDRNRCLETGMDEYLAKPVEPQKLYTMLETCLEKRQRQQSSTLEDKDGKARRK